MGTPPRQGTYSAAEELPARVRHVPREPATSDVELDQPHVSLLTGRADDSYISMLMNIDLDNRDVPVRGEQRVNRFGCRV
jgi:hypothetical protein